MNYHVHYEIGQRQESISGYYQVIEEGTLSVNGREILYVTEVAHAETSCCGPGSVFVIRVPGYLISYKTKSDADNNPISQVEPISDEEVRAQVKKLLRQKFPSFAQIDFGQGFGK